MAMKSSLPRPTQAPQVIHQLRPRQQQGGSASTQSASNSNAQASSNSNANSNSNSNANSNAQSGSNSNSQSAAQSSSGTTPTAVSIPITAPAGGLQFTQPPQTAAASFYKIAPNQPITFGWNLTSLYITPPSLTVSAFCSANGNTYPVGPTDGVIPGTATQVVWDPYSYQQAHSTQPLIIASYTLHVVDGHGLTQAPAPGRFAPNTQMTFALYKPQSYTPLASWTCSGCSGAALSVTTHPVFLSLVVTFLVMLLGGWGVLRRR